MSNAQTEIPAMLADYFDGFYEADLDKLRKVFHPSCHLYEAITGELHDSDMDAVYGRVGNRTVPAERGDPHDYSIVTIDQSGPECAFAKVTLGLGNNMYTDYLTLLKMDGQWRIITKTFTSQPRDVAPL